MSEDVISESIENFVKEFKLSHFLLDFHTDFGVDHKTGWSVSADGVSIVALVPSCAEAMNTAHVKLMENYKNRLHELIDIQLDGDAYNDDDQDLRKLMGWLKEQSVKAKANKQGKQNDSD